MIQVNEEQNIGGTVEDRKTEQGVFPVPGFADWGDLVAAMRAMRTSVFPVDSVVRVDDPRFHGIGIVSRDEACPIEKLAVRVESLNVWWYPVEHCQPYRGAMLHWMRRFLRSHRARRAYPSSPRKRPSSDLVNDGQASLTE